MRRTVVIDIPGLMASFIGDRTPNLAALARLGGTRVVAPVLPAVGPTMEATYLTGLLPRAHGVVGSAWYARDLAEILVQRSSSRLVEGERVWEAARRADPSFTSASVCWSGTAYGSSDYTVALRSPGRGDDALPVLAEPASLGAELVKELGPFPTAEHWGPTAGIAATRWIGRAARHVYATRQPTLTLVSLPHLDRAIQRLGPDHPDLGRELDAIDAVCGELFERIRRDGTRVVVLSPHGATSVESPVYPNRVLREAQLLAVRDVGGRELLDPGASDAFAVVDRQVAHVYVRRAEQIASVKALLEAQPGVEAVLDRDGLRARGLDHARSGELCVISAADRWLAYPWWSEDRVAPEFARTVATVEKAGHDPAELFLDPLLFAPRVRLAVKTFLRRMGLAVSVDVVPLAGNLVRGSYGRVAPDVVSSPVLLSSEPELLPEHVVEATEVKRLLLEHVFDGPAKTKKPVLEHHLQLLSAAGAEVKEPAKNGKHAPIAFESPGTALE